MGSGSLYANVLVLFTVPLPSLFLVYRSVSECPVEIVIDTTRVSSLLWGGWCFFYQRFPLSAENFLFFFNVNVFFWIISMIQGSTWVSRYMASARVLAYMAITTRYKLAVFNTAYRPLLDTAASFHWPLLSNTPLRDQQLAIWGSSGPAMDMEHTVELLISTQVHVPKIVLMNVCCSLWLLQ